MGAPISSFSSASQYQAEGVNTYQQRRQSFDALAQALQSNNLSAARQAFASFTQNFPGGAAQPNSPLAQIGQALQSNDLTAAQNAFAALKAGRHGNHHHHGNPQSDVSTTGSSQPTTTPNVGNTINISA